MITTKSIYAQNLSRKEGEKEVKSILWWIIYGFKSDTVDGVTVTMSASRCRCCCFESWAACSCRGDGGGSWFGAGAGWGSCCRAGSIGGPPRAAPPSGPNGRRSFCRRARTRTSAWRSQPRSCCRTGSEALPARTRSPSRSICGSLASAQWRPANEISIRDDEALPEIEETTHLLHPDDREHESPEILQRTDVNGLINLQVQLDTHFTLQRNTKFL